MLIRPLLVLFPFTVAVACSNDGAPASNTNGATGGSSGVDGSDASTQLPDCHGAWPEPWAAMEGELIQAVNAARAKGGTCSGVTYPAAPAVATDPALTIISRCFAREQILAGSNALVGGAADSAIHDQLTAANFQGQLTRRGGTRWPPRRHYKFKSIEGNRVEP